MIDKLGRTFGVNATYQAQAGNERSRHDIDRYNTQKAYAYYKKDVQSIRAYLNSYLSKIINQKTLLKMPLVTVNYIIRFILYI